MSSRPRPPTRPAWRRERQQADRIEELLGLIAKRPAHPWLQSIVAVLVTLIAAYYVPLWLAQPEVAVLGVRPVHESGQPQKEKERGFPPIYSHTLGLIFELHNTGGSESFVHDAKIEGCVPIDFLMAEGALNPEGEGGNIADLQNEYRDARQRIRVTGAPIGDNRVPPRGRAIIAIEFPFRGGGYAVHLNQNAISRNGDCTTLTGWMQEPDVGALLEFRGPRTKSRARRLASGFQTGDLEILLFVGSQSLSVRPEQLKPLVRVNWPDWRRLSYPEIYRNPSESYYQRAPGGER